MIDRKLDLLVRELNRHGISIAGIQETNGLEAMWGLLKGIPFTLWSSLLSDYERGTRNEGVGIALDKKATAAWKNAGEVYEVVSSSVVMARWMWTGLGKKHGRPRRSTDSY